MDDSRSSESWNKLVISKSQDQWITSIKSERLDEDEVATTAGFCLDYDPFRNVEVAINVRNKNFTSIAESHSSEQNLLCERKPQISPKPKAERRTESSEHRAERLAKMSAYAAQRLAKETPEQRALRLKRMSKYAANRLANETSEQRARRLQRMSAYAAKRLSNETPEQRQERLTRMSAYAARRHAMKKKNQTDLETGKRRRSRTTSSETNINTSPYEFSE